jgi:hypothetical protein
VGSGAQPQWTEVVMANGNYPAWAQGAAIGPSGTAVVAGRFRYIGRRSASGSFAPVSGAPAGIEWLDGVGAGPGGRFWIVGQGGTILRSTDDGASFGVSAPPGSGSDLYAVSFLDEFTGLAVGAHGSARITYDGGEEWTDVPIGRDVFVGDAVFIDAMTIMVVGERGLAATMKLLAR